MTDSIADMLTRIRNAYLAGKEKVEIPHSKTTETLARILKEEGFVKEVQKKSAKPRSAIIVTLAYKGKVPALEGIMRMSKPGRRMYARVKKIPTALGGYGVTIISTNQGIMTDKKAREKGVGGEVLCKVW